MKRFAHQQRAVEIAQDKPRYGFFWEMGTGKTIAMLAVCADRRIKTVVIAPKAIVDAAWINDARHFPDLIVISGRLGSPRTRKSIIESTWDVLVINPELFKKHVEDFAAAGVRRLIVDESSMLKSHDSQITKAVVLFSARCDECYILSGTPAPNGPHELWGQLRCINPSKTSASFWRWAYQHLTPSKRWVAGKEVISGWTLANGQKEAFERSLAGCSWALRKEDAVDLPERTDEFREVELSPAERKAYVELRDLLAAEWDGGTLNATANSRLMKLRQVTGGMFYDKERVVEIGSSKLDELEDVLSEIGGKPVVIWAEFTADIDRIAARLNCPIIDGRTSDENRKRYIGMFGPEMPWLVCHPKAVGHGITLVQASYAIYYSLGYSYETYAQSRDRIHRIGQRHPCTYIHLVAADTCDRRIVEVLARKGSAAEAMRAALDGSGIKDDVSGNRIDRSVIANAF